MMIPVMAIHTPTTIVTTITTWAQTLTNKNTNTGMG